MPNNTQQTLVNKTLPFREFTELDASLIKLSFKFPLRECVEKEKEIIKFPLKERVQQKDNSIKLPLKETTLALQTVQGKVKLPVRETSKGKLVALPVSEIAWVLNGFVIEENIIEHLNKNLVIMEHVRSRILFNAELLDKTHMRVNWYGGEVDFVDVFDKYSIEDDYPAVPLATVPWDEGGYTFQLDDASHDIKLECHDGYGESGVLTVGDMEHLEVDVFLELPVNEKIYSIDIDYPSVYRIEVIL